MRGVGERVYMSWLRLGVFGCTLVLVSLCVAGVLVLYYLVASFARGSAPEGCGWWPSPVGFGLVAAC